MLSTAHRALPLTSVLLLGGCQPDVEPVPAGSELAMLLPEASSMAGWVVAEGPDEYSAGTVYEYLDGGAERYLGYGFRSMIHIRYQLGDDLMSSVTLDLYDMGSALGAFGIFSVSRPTDAETMAWGAGGFRAGTVAAAWRDKVYLHAEADDTRPELEAMAGWLVAAACEAASGALTPPALLDPLPADHLVAGSERWVAADLLGHSFLPGGVRASYRIDGGEAELFFSDLGSETAAGEAMARLLSHYKERGEIASDEPSIGADGFRFSSPALGTGTVVTAGGFVAGVHGELSPGVREDLLEALIDALEAGESA